MYTTGIDMDLTYVGCYADERGTRAMTGSFITSSSMTNEVSGVFLIPLVSSDYVPKRFCSSGQSGKCASLPLPEACGQAPGSWIPTRVVS